MSPDLLEIAPPALIVDPAAAARAPPKRERIQALLVDADPLDNVSVARIAVRSKQLEIVVTACVSLDEAKTLLAKRRFDVIYLEYWLGEETSIAFIHDMAALHDVPCVVLTDLDEPDIRRLAFRAGAHAFLSKDALGPQALESVTLAVLRPRLDSLMAQA